MPDLTFSEQMRVQWRNPVTDPPPCRSVVLALIKPGRKLLLALVCVDRNPDLGDPEVPDAPPLAYFPARISDYGHARGLDVDPYENEDILAWMPPHVMMPAQVPRKKRKRREW